jgi:hypothetical protein
MVAVTFALPNESRQFVRLVANHNRKVTILHTGVGEKNCARIEPFLDSQRRSPDQQRFRGRRRSFVRRGRSSFKPRISPTRLLAEAQELLTSRVGRLVSADRVIESASDRLPGTGAWRRRR